MIEPADGPATDVEIEAAFALFNERRCANKTLTVHLLLRCRVLYGPPSRFSKTYFPSVRLSALALLPFIDKAI